MSTPEEATVAIKTPFDLVDKDPEVPAAPESLSNADFDVVVSDAVGSL
jgi:hypothetical protein